MLAHLRQVQRVTHFTLNGLRKAIKSLLEDPRQTRGFGSSGMRSYYVKFHIIRQADPVQCADKRHTACATSAASASAMAAGLPTSIHTPSRRTPSSPPPPPPPPNRPAPPHR